jgi:hypothetical protein
MFGTVIAILITYSIYPNNTIYILETTNTNNIIYYMGLPTNNTNTNNTIYIDIHLKNKKQQLPKWVILSRDVNFPKWVILSRDVK